MKKTVNYLILMLLCFPTIGFCQQEKPKNIILIMANGVSSNLISAAMAQNQGTLNISRFEITGFTKPFNSNGTVPPSIAISNAIACGVKNQNEVIGLNDNHDSVVNILEIARLNKMVTGIVTTGSITSADASVFYSHEKDVTNHERIADDLLLSHTNVFIGGGAKYFKGRTDNRDLLFQLKKEGYKILDKPKDLEKSSGKMVAGLVAPEKLPFITELRGNYLSEAFMRSFKTLVRYDSGFMVVISNPHIEAACLKNNAEIAVKELLDLDKVIGTTLDLLGPDNETLIVVVCTADAGGASLSGASKPGKIQLDFSSTSITPQIVPVFAHGPGASSFSGIYDNTQIFFKIRNLLLL